MELSNLRPAEGSKHSDNFRSFANDRRGFPVSRLRPRYGEITDEKAGHERKGLCAFDECCPIHSASLDQRSCTALRYSKTPHADL